MATAALCSYDDINTQDENTVKALFIYNFTKHIEWPAPKQSSSKFEISVFGNSALAAKLSSILKDRKVLDKPIEIKEISNPEDAFNSRILFIGSLQTAKLNAILDKFNGKSVLIITEERKMSTHGACINIYTKENHLRFELNDITIRHEGFKVSNQLYELATVSR